MANRWIFSPLRILSRNRVVVAGSFAPNGASAVSAASNRGDDGWSVVRTSEGLFTLTLDDVFTQDDSITATLQLASGDDKAVQVGAVDIAARTIQLRVWDASGAAVADVAADADNRISFCIVLKNSSIFGR